MNQKNIDILNRATLNILLFIIMVAYTGFLFSKSWQYFIVPVFDIKQITILQGIGISIIAKIFIFFKNDNIKKDETIEDKLKEFRSHIFNFIALFIVIYGFHYLQTLLS